jgi:hypothetical protein
MMTLLRYTLLLPLLVFTFSAHAQTEPPRPKGSVRFYYYAAATAEKDGRSVLYLTPVKFVDFNKGFDPQKRPGLREEMGRQYLNAIDTIYSQARPFTFTTYDMQSKKAKVEKVFNAVMDDFKAKGYEIILVKEFNYD